MELQQTDNYRVEPIQIAGATRNAGTVMIKFIKAGRRYMVTEEQFQRYRYQQLLDYYMKHYDIVKGQVKEQSSANTTSLFQ